MKKDCITCEGTGTYKGKMMLLGFPFDRNLGCYRCYPEGVEQDIRSDWLPTISDATKDGFRLLRFMTYVILASLAFSILFL